MESNLPLGISQGLDLTKLDSITPEELNNNLFAGWRWRGSLYNVYAQSLMLDFNPEFAKLHRWNADLFAQPNATNVVLFSMQNLHSYMMSGWEVGILNEFHALRRNGMTLNQLMEIVLFGQLHAGMRGLGHVYRAVGDLIPVWKDPDQPVPWPDGWAPDPDAFKSGLDMSQRRMTDADRKNLTDWYERTIGEVPNSVAFAMKRYPEFLKITRAKWEVAIRTLPKQVVPYILLRHNTITNNEEGLREATLLAKAWGVSSTLIVQAISVSAAYFTGLEGLYAAHNVVDELL